MQIQLQEVTTEYVKKGAKGYSVANVVYTSNGRNSNKKIFSFSAPQVFEAVKNATPGLYEVKVQKNGEYWDWVGFEPANGAVQQAAAPQGGKVFGAGKTEARGNWETPEERKLRQMFIIKQSSIGHAIELLTVGAKTPPTTADVLKTAQEFVDYVYGIGAEEEVGKMDPEIEDIPY